MKFSSYSIQKKLMLLLAFSIIVPSLIFCLFSYNSTTAIIRKNYETQTLNSLNASAQSISSKISIADTSVRQIHFDTELIELLSTDGRCLLYTSVVCKGQRYHHGAVRTLPAGCPGTLQYH